MERGVGRSYGQSRGLGHKKFFWGLRLQTPSDSLLLFSPPPPIQKVLRRSLVRCLNKSSSFYNAGSNSSKGLTRKSKNGIKENNGIPDSK